jgi:hypothetical protein
MTALRCPTLPLLGLLSAAAGCASAPAARPAVGCAAPCAVVAKVWFPETVQVDVHVPAGTLLKNAAVSAPNAAACESGVPVEAVAIDDQDIAEGPAALPPNSQVTLRFPFGAGWDLPTVMAPPVFLDLDLQLAVSGTRSCLRLPLPRPDGRWDQLVSQLSLRRKERD